LGSNSTLIQPGTLSTTLLACGSTFAASCDRFHARMKAPHIRSVSLIDDCQADPKAEPLNIRTA
jgi:hypothetical protein